MSSGLALKQLALRALVSEEAEESFFVTLVELHLLDFGVG